VLSAGPLPTMAAMIEGIIGVAVGWVLSVLTEEWRARKARLADNARERADLREVSRLILEELRASQRLVEDAVGGSGAEWDLEQRLPADVWNRRSAALARSAEHAEVWNAVSEAFGEIDRINWAVRRMQQRGTTLTQWEDFKARLERALDRIEAGTAALQRLI
jgi:hypothetical protein